MMLKKVLILIAVLPVLALLAYALTLDPRAIPSPLVGRQAGDFSLSLFDGGQFTLVDQRGKVVVMNVWSSWCIPACYNEAPALEAAWQRYRGREVVVVGVNYQDRDAAAREFLARFRHTFPNGPDVGSKIAIEYGVRGVPETFFIDRDGRLVHRHVGEISFPILVQHIEQLLQGTGGT
jgi:cytochrome c biogenesis protein CcmG, thiol:disulfide interchange protein DsbE